MAMGIILTRVRTTHRNDLACLEAGLRGLKTTEVAGTAGTKGVLHGVEIKAGNSLHCGSLYSSLPMVQPLVLAPAHRQGEPFLIMCGKRGSQRLSRIA